MKDKLKLILASCYWTENGLAVKKHGDLMENLVASSMCAAVNKNRPGEWVICTGSKNTWKNWESLKGLKVAVQQWLLQRESGCPVQQSRGLHLTHVNIQTLAGPAMHAHITQQRKKMKWSYKTPKQGSSGICGRGRFFRNLPALQCIFTSLWLLVSTAIC